MSGQQERTAQNLALVDVLGELRHDLAQASVTLGAAAVMRSESDVRTLVGIAIGAVTRLHERMTTLRELLIAK